MSTIYWCRGCGFEDTKAHNTCSACGSALTQSELEWLTDGSRGEETIYELETTPIQRAGLVEALIDEKIPHRWDSVEELVVATSDEDAVDSIIDDVLHEEVEVVEDDAEGDDAEPVEVLDGESEEGDDEGATEQYEAMTQLFFSSDRLLKKWEDGDVGTFIADATQLTMLDAPYGVEDEDWADLQALARNSAMTLQEDQEADIEEDVKSLRDRLKALI